MIDFIADVDTWIVFQIADETYFTMVLSGGRFTSPHTCEFFYDELEAKARAIELGWVDPFADSGGF